jgi:RNA polymerase sigma-70 factor (ECF subfamily)
MSPAMPPVITLPLADEAALVGRARAGDRAAFDDLVRAHHAALYRLAMRSLGDADEAADLCQHAFVRAFSSMPRFRGEARFRTWLFRIALRLLADAWRERARTVRLEPGDEVPAPPPREPPADLDRLRLAIAGLPPRQRAVVELRTYESMTFREVAHVLATTVVAAKVNYHYAVKRLRREMSR